MTKSTKGFETMQRIPLDRINTDERLQNRDDYSREYEQREAVSASLNDMVEGCVRSLAAGKSLEPIKVLVENGHYYIVDGHHRYESYCRYFEYAPYLKDKPTRSDANIPVEILDGDMLYHLSNQHKINTQHGRTLEPTERSQALLRALVYRRDLAEMESVRQQQADSHLSEAQVKKIRKAAKILIDESEIKPNDKLEDIDAKIFEWSSGQKLSQDMKRLPSDSHGFPKVNYVVSRKVITEEQSRQYRLDLTKKRLTSLLNNDPDVFLDALQKVQREAGLKLKGWREAKAILAASYNDEPIDPTYLDADFDPLDDHISLDEFDNDKEF